MTVIASKTFTTELVRESTYSTRKLGRHKSTMDLHRTAHGTLFIEWDVPSLETTEHIGLTLLPKSKHVSEYDGIMGYLPQEAADLLAEAGYTVDPECLGK